MISLFGYSLHALYPLAILGIPLGGAFLVYVYRSLGDSKKTVISSLFLLKDLPRASPGRKKFIPPPQFWIELLCCLTLALAAAGIVAERQGEHIAIVLDTSLSMSSTTTQGQSRLDQAKKQALSHLAQSSHYTRFTVFEARGTAHRLTTEEVSSSEAADAIEKVSYAVEQDRLSATFESLYSSGDFDGVWLYTDHPITKSDQDPNAPPTRITSLPSSSDRSTEVNLWISDIVESSADGGSNLQVYIQGSTPAPVSATVTVSCYLRSLKEQLGAPISKQVSISHGSPMAVRIDSLPSTWRFCKATVIPNSTTLHDSIANDNIAWIIHASTQQQFYLRSSIPLQQLGLDKLKTPTILQEPRSNELQEDPPAIKQPTIFHRTSLPETAPPPTFAILPPAGKLPWGGSISQEEVKGGEITRWSTSHPILQYLNVPTLILPSARIVNCPDTATPILFSREGSIGCAGESPSGRYVILGFEVFPFDGARSPAASILALNILKWLLQDVSLENRPRPPGYQLLPAGTVTATEVDSNRIISDFDDSRRIFLKGSSLIEFLDKSGNSTGQAASLFSSSYESDVRNESVLNVSLTTEKAKEKRNTSSDVWRYIAIVASILLALDIYRKLRGRSRWEAP
jgi:hypothetical protein